MSTGYINTYDSSGNLLTSGASDTTTQAQFTAMNASLDAIEAATADTTAVNVTPSGAYTVTAAMTVDTAALAAGDVMDTAAFAVTSFFLTTTSLVEIVGLEVTDLDDQGVGFDLYLLNAATSLGTKNGAPSIADGNAPDIIGIIPIDAADYYDVGAFRKAFTGEERKILIKANGSVTTLWLGGITRGAPTYAGGVITIKFKVKPC